MSNKVKMKRELRIEGFLYIPKTAFVRNPAITLEAGRIAAVREAKNGPFQLKGCLFPCLVNAHVHLDFNRPVWAKNFTSWIEKIILSSPNSRGISKKTTKALSDLRRKGIKYCFDITPTLEYPLLVLKGVVPFFEVRGKADEFSVEIPEGFMLSPHAPYSVSAELIRNLKRAYPNRLFMTHLAESEEEVKFLKGERNEIEERIYPLVGRKRMIKSYKGFWEFLSDTGLFGKNVILAHCIWVGRRDVEFISQTGTNAVICPRSNLYLSGRLAPVREMLNQGVNIALGTDGLSSSPDLNLWEEGKALFFAERIRPSEILKMMTVNGLRILGIEPLESIENFVLLETESKTEEDLSFEILFRGEEIVSAVFF